MNALAGILGIAVVAGVNLYAAILTLGLGLRFGWIQGLPGELQILQHPGVLAAAAVFYTAEFVADKVPFFTPIWDAVHTFIRPVGAALLAFGAAGDLHPAAQVAAVLIAGPVALGMHSSKMGIRLLAHAAPEPVTHSAISIAEDVGVIGLLLLAYNYPYIAVPVLLALLGAMVWLAPLLLRILRLAVSGTIVWLESMAGPASQSEVPGWARRGASGAHLTRVFGRKGPFPRLCLGYLTEDALVYRKWLQPRVRKLAGIPGARLEKGVFVDILILSNGVSFYLTKDWSRDWERMDGGQQIRQALQKPAELS